MQSIQSLLDTNPAVCFPTTSLSIPHPSRGEIILIKCSFACSRMSDSQVIPRFFLRKPSGEK